MHARYRTWCACLAVAVGLALGAGCGSSTPDLNPPPDPSIPGVNPSVQDWMASRAPTELALDDALSEVQPLLKQPPPAAAAACVRIADSAKALLGMPAPVPALTGPALAGLDQFVGAAESCRAGDYAGASQQIADAANLRADASLQLDMLLMGHTGHH